MLLPFFLSIYRLTHPQAIDIKAEKQPVKKVILSTLGGKVILIPILKVIQYVEMEAPISRGQNYQV